MKSVPLIRLNMNFWILLLLLGAVCIKDLWSAEVLRVYDTLPASTFDCKGRPYGYYADPEFDCQLFHVCHQGRKYSFLCGNQTVFNQALLVCDWPQHVDCASADGLYKVNERFNEETTTQAQA